MICLHKKLIVFSERCLQDVIKHHSSRRDISHVIHSLYNKESPAHCRFWIFAYTQPLLEGMVKISVVSPSEHVYRICHS